MARNLLDYVVLQQQLISDLGAAYLEVAGGVAAYTGLGSPLTTVKGIEAHPSADDLDEIESFFDRHDMAVVRLELAPWVHENTKGLLRERGYAPDGSEDVVALAIRAGRPTEAPPRAEAVPVEAWPELMRCSYELSEESPTELLASAAHLPDAQLWGLRQNGRWIACAQSVPYGNVVIFGNDGTHPEARGTGAQTALIEDRLRVLPVGTIATAEVAPGSGSERNYLRCGFRIAYTRTHYVRPPR